MRRRGGRGRLAVDWPSCAGRGLCAEVLPEHVTLDEWGYPVTGAEVPPERLELAREAVRACPHQALRLLAVPSPP